MSLNDLPPPSSASLAPYGGAIKYIADSSDTSKSSADRRSWGNWQYQAGVGNDARASRQFNPIKQAADYDPSNEYIRLWIPELKNVPDDKAQTPWRECH